MAIARMLTLAAVLLIPGLAAAQSSAPASRPAAPVVECPRVTCDRWPSHYDAKSWIEDVWRIENARTGEQKALALYKWVRLQQHWGDQCHGGTRGTHALECDAIKKLNIYPYGECSDFGVTAAALGHAGGLEAREAHVPGHTQLEVRYKDADGAERWHRLDPFWGVVVYDRSGSHIATWQEIRDDAAVALQPVRTVLPWGDKVSDRQRFAEKAAIEPERRVRPSVSTMDKPLYAGERYALGWERDDDLGFVNANPDARDGMTLWGFPRYQYAGGDVATLAHGHELLRPHIEKVGDQLQVRPAHGMLLFRPVLDERFADSLYQPAANVRSVRTAAGSRLHPAKAGEPAELVYLVQVPYVIADARIGGAFATAAGGRVRVSIARADWREQDYTVEQAIPDKPAWKAVWQSQADGPQAMRLREAELQLRGEYRFLVKIELLAGEDPASAQIAELGFLVRFQEGVMALPRLLPGRNVIHVTAGRIQPDYGLAVQYIWDDADGRDHQVRKVVEQVPAEFEIRAAGSQPADVRTVGVIVEAVRLADAQ